MKRPEIAPTRLGTGPGRPVNDPRAAQYLADVRARQAGRTQPQQQQMPPRYATPVAGGPTPPIPHLDLPPTGQGTTMADQAIGQRTAMPGGMSILAPPTGDGLLASDILPAEARSDPNFQQGAGDMIAVNQPHLARKYGVIRNGRPVPPQQLAHPTQQRRGLKPETVEGLADVARFNQERKKAESGEDGAEKAAAAGPAGAAARIANNPGDTDITPGSAEDVKKRIENMDDFDFAAFRQAMMKDLLNNNEQRETIEARLEPLELTDLIMKGRIRQFVPIIPGKFEPEFQSMTGAEDLALKRLVMEETKSLGATAAYMLDKFSMMSAAVGIYAINKKPLPDHCDAAGNWDDELFKKKFELFVKFPFHLIASVGVNYFWFDVRVRKLFVAEKVKKWLNTPEGWARANILLATLREPPPVGSLRETLLITLWLQKEQMEFSQTFAIIQTMVDKTKSKEAFDEYRKTRFPWIESSKKKQQAEDIKKLMEEVKRGALAITPQASPRLRSRLKAKLVKRQAEQATKEQRQVYDKIGAAIPR